MTEKRKEMLNELKALYNTTDDEKNFIIEFEKACEESPDDISGNFQLKIIYEAAKLNKKMDDWANS